MTTMLTELTSKFRHVHLIPAREQRHREADTHEGYDLLVPLDQESRLDPVEWKDCQHLCRVRRYRSKGADFIGRLRRRPDGQWYIDYLQGIADDEIAFHFGDERFIQGEFVSIGNRGAMRSYRIALVEKP